MSYYSSILDYLCTVSMLAYSLRIASICLFTCGRNDKPNPFHAQERFLADANEQGVKRPEKTYYMPTDADTPIRAFRKWYNSRGGGGPTWAKVREVTGIGQEANASRGTPCGSHGVDP